MEKENWKEKALDIIAKETDGCWLCVHGTHIRGGFIDCPYEDETCVNRSLFQISKEKFQKEYNVIV